MWLTGRLAPDFKTIADFRRDNGAAICAACAQFIVIVGKSAYFSVRWQWWTVANSKA